MIVSVIVAVGKNNEIGKDNDIPWYLPADLKYFKKTTVGHPIIMGRKCFESIGKALPNRTNIIVSRNPEFYIDECILVHSIAAGLEIAKERGAEEAFIIGGGEIYEQGISLASRIYLTEVDVLVPDADIFFPKINSKDWKLIKEEVCLKDEKNPYNYTFKVLERQ